MHVAALLVAGDAKLDDDGALNAWRIPTTCFEVDQIPLEVTIPLVVVVHAQAGSNHDPRLYIVCKDPDGQPQGGIELSWHWPDDEDKPSKYRCFTHSLPFMISAEGEYTIGIYYDSYGTAQLATPIPLSIKLVGSDASGSNGDGVNEAPGEASS